MSNPVDAYLASQETEKTAFLGRARQVLKDPLAQMAANLAIGGAIFGGGPLLRKAHFAITKKRDFNDMMEANPDLQEFRSENAPQFNQHYNSLRKLNPEFAADPVVAGTYMRQMSHSPATAGKVIVESLAGRRGLQPAPGSFKQMMVPTLPQEDEAGELRLKGLKRQEAEAQRGEEAAGQQQPLPF